MRSRTIAIALAVGLLAGCSSGSTEPTPPGGANGTADLRGTWVQTIGEARTWVLGQSDAQASGSATYSQLLAPNVGTVSGTGRVSGTVTARAYRFTETYQNVSIPSRPSAVSCALDAEGELTLAGTTTLRGSVRESVACFGVQLAQVTRDVVMQKR